MRKMAVNLEGRIKSASVGYNIFPWWFYPSNWASHFPFKPLLKKYAKFSPPPKTIATIDRDGKFEGKIAKFKFAGDLGKAHYMAAYQFGQDTLDPLVEAAQDASREHANNNEKMHYNRRTAFTVHVPNGPRIVVQQQRKSFFDSWYGLPFKLPVYLATMPFNLTTRILGNKELVELGKIHEVENLPDGSDVKLDENYIKRMFSLFLGKYYEVRDQLGNVYFKIKRSPFVKLFTLGLKNLYKVKFFRDNNATDYKTALAMVDYIKREWSYRLLKKPPSTVSVEDVFQYQ